MERQTDFTHAYVSQYLKKHVMPREVIFPEDLTVFCFQYLIDSIVIKTGRQYNCQLISSSYLFSW